MKRAFIFDMDGVIIDSEPIHLEIGVSVMRELGLEPSEKEIHEFVGVSNKDMWTILIERHGMNQPLDYILELHKSLKIKRFSTEKLDPVEGIPELAAQIRNAGLKIALATSSPRFLAEHILNQLGLLSYFDAMVTADDIKRSKPDPEVFVKAAAALGVVPEECIVLEDSGFGIQAAKKAGMQVIAYKNPSSGNQDTRLADYVVSSIKDIDTRWFKD